MSGVPMPFGRRHGRLRHRALRSPQCASNGCKSAADLSPAALSTGPLPTCRICWEGESATSSPLLEDTCSCAGSLAHVHVRCLLQWQRLARDPHTCATCKAPVRIPVAAVAAVSLPPRWAAWAQRELHVAQISPAKTLLKWWNRAISTVGLLQAINCSQRAWTAAPGLAVQLRDLPLQQGRWQLLVGMVVVTLYQHAWLPCLRVPQRVLGLHALCYAGGMVLDLGGLRLDAALAENGPGGLATAAAGGLCKALVYAGVALQVAAVQHLHPLNQFVNGYAKGVNSACAFTGGLLLRATRAMLKLLGDAGTGAVGRLVQGTARLLPFFLHSIAHSLALAGRLPL